MPKWTKEQQAAIDAEGGAVLVSAAAGSGKTAVIVARVLRKLTEKVNPMNIDELLLVTFTKAAAAEMRERISAAIAGQVVQEPNNRHLKQQLLLVQRAQIKTVHALCLQIVQENAMQLGLPPDFRLMDERERNVLFAQVLENTMEDAYEKAEPGFDALTALLLDGKDDKPLENCVRYLYQKIQAQAWPQQYLEDMRALLYQGDMNTPTVALLMTKALAAARQGLYFIERGVAAMQGVEALESTYLPAFQSDLQQVQHLIAVLEAGDWDAAVGAAREIVSLPLKAARKCEDKQLMETLKVWRKEWKDTLEKIQGSWLCISAQEALWDRAHVAPALSALIDLVARFDTNMQAEKRKRALLDFGDMEHYAIALLYEDGKPSMVARTLSGQFREIMVDEYQDTNAVQEAIFRALSREETNLFMVGDVKQSIYGFRLADPSIFLEKYQSFQPLEKAGAGAPGSVVLGQNFRSRAEVLDAANYIFRHTMGERVGGLAYTEREALHLGADYPKSDNTDYRMEVFLLDAKKADAEDTREKMDLEAVQVASRIRALLDEGFLVTDKQTGALRPVRPDDIVILLRSTSNKAGAYLRALDEVGLVGSAEEASGLLGAIEVQTMVSFLTVLDNPRQDIPLIGVLRSPLYAFSEEELAQLRLRDRKASIYDLLLLAAPEDEKVARFLAHFQSLRTRAHDMPVFSLLSTIYEETAALALYGALPGGDTRRANLLAFLERTRAFEEQGYRGLFAYVRLLAGMLENGDDFARVVSKEQGGTVRVMTIHKSKGLEFPVVVLADVAKRFNFDDLKKPVLLHGKLGLASKCKDETRGVQYNTTERVAIALAQRTELISEEIRILYVALTRAKEKLIVSASLAHLESSLRKWAMYASVTPVPQYAMGEIDTMLGWVMTALLRHPCTGALRAELDIEVPEDMEAPDVFTVTLATRGEAQEPVGFADLPVEAEIAEPTVTLPPKCAYPFASVVDLPSKITATGLERGYQAQEAAEWTGRKRSAEKTLRTPIFVRGEKTLRPTEIGTAHHQFLQFCDFDAAGAAGGVAREIERLREKKVLSEEAAQALDAGKLEAFFASPLFRERFARAEVRREFKFSVLVPASWAFPESGANAKEEVLLQGVIDCLLEDENGFTIVDFKTDAVRAPHVQARAERYRAQLDAYAMATQRIFGKPVHEKILFFLHEGNTVVFGA